MKEYINQTTFSVHLCVPAMPLNHLWVYAYVTEEVNGIYVHVRTVTKTPQRSMYKSDTILLIKFAISIL